MQKDSPNETLITTSRLAAVLGLLLGAATAAACGGIESMTAPGDSPDAGSESETDASETDASPAGCSLQDDYQDLGALTGSGFLEIDEVTSKPIVFFALDLPGDDLVSVRLHDGVGVFTDGIPVGDTTLPSSPVDCAACVQIVDDPSELNGARFLEAQGGVLGIDSVDLEGETPRIVGKLTNVTFSETAQETDPCTTKLGAATFDVALDKAVQE